MYQPLMTDEFFDSIIIKPHFDIGTSRKVFAVRDDPNVVVKKIKETGFDLEGYSSNFLEWYLWSVVKRTDIAHLFGECIATSFSRIYLMMERLNDLEQHELRNVPPIPEWVQDTRPNAFGKSVSGEIKIRDYGRISIGTMLANAPLVRRFKLDG
jgi:hypothetical protein